MPVGIPKVPYLLPEDEDSSWIDLYNRLYQQRLLVLGQEINIETGNNLAALMIYLSLEDKTKDLNLFINSPGGGLVEGLGLYNTMQYVEAEVQTVCVGLAASMASLVLLGGQTTKRLALPHSRIMIHQPASTYMDGKTGDSLLDMSELQVMKDLVIDIYAHRTGKPSWQISKDMRKDLFMSPEEAQAYGIIDTIAETHFK